MTRRTGLVLAASLATTTPSALGDVVLVGITQSGDLVEIDLDTGAATTITSFGDDVGGSMAYLPGSDRLGILRAAGEPGELLLIDPSDWSLSGPLPITGLPKDQQKTGGIGALVEDDAFVVTFGPTGTFLENRLARLRLDGVVTETSPDIGLGDNDGCFWDALGGQLLVNDYNASDGLPRLASLADPFGVPTWTAWPDEPPVLQTVGDSAMHPIDGRIFVIDFDGAGGALLEIVGDAWVEVGPFDVGSQVVGIAFRDVGCPEDLDGDDVVGFGDLLALLAEWGPCDACAADLDDDGTVAFTDLLALLAAWGPCD